MQVSRRAFFGISASAATGTALGGLAGLRANLAPALARAQQLMWGALLLFGVEGWLLTRCMAAAGGPSVGAVRAMAREVFTDWHFAKALSGFQTWLDAGAPSDDATRAV
jgi:hypothetical protein